MRQPVLFAAHGSPLLALDREKGKDYAAWAGMFPKPKGILAISSHWLTKSLVIGATERAPVIHDYYGFPQELYEMDYPAPGAPELAEKTRQFLKGKFEVAENSERGLDHGVWVPLLHMYPNADVPVLPVSMPGGYPSSELLKLGGALAPLRDDGVTIFISGNLTHNLSALDFSGKSPPHQWAVEFIEWLKLKLHNRDVTAISNYATAPHYRMCHPTDDHFTPLLVAMGAAGSGSKVSFPVDGFEYGSLSRLCVMFS
ncbi:MAG: dioxygenase [Nitrospinae bacterium]|nr:dioxygenase [Nitrospinota bacterium]